MVIREDLVASAAKFLQDPSVASSPPESRISFLKAKNLTPEEVNAALSRAGFEAATPSYAASAVSQPPPHQSPAAPFPGQPQPPYYGGPYAQQQQYPPYGWQPPRPDMPRRDWRDWFIMATLVGGVGYGLFSMTKRYIYPLVAPPTPDRLEQDKKMIDEQFERAFALVEQLAKDTDALKEAEKERTERLDAALLNLETVLGDLKVASKRREDDAERLRDDVRGLKEALPKALDAQRDVTDGRLREVNAELKGLKTLIGQRMASGSNNNSSNNASISSSYLRPSVTTPPPETSAEKTATPETAVAGTDANNSNGVAHGYSASGGIAGSTNSASAASPFTPAVKASIPAWQRAMAKPASPAPATTESNTTSA